MSLEETSPWLEELNIRLFRDQLLTVVRVEATDSAGSLEQYDIAISDLGAADGRFTALAQSSLFPLGIDLEYAPAAYATKTDVPLHELIETTRNNWLHGKITRRRRPWSIPEAPPRPSD